MGNRKNIFLSHAAGDQRLADLVRVNLNQADRVETVPDELRMETGMELRRALRSLIAGASDVVVLWTPLAAESAWVQYEVGLAHAPGRSIIVIASNDDASDEEMPEVLRCAPRLRYDEIAKLAS